MVVWVSYKSSWDGEKAYKNPEISNKLWQRWRLEWNIHKQNKKYVFGYYLSHTFLTSLTGRKWINEISGDAVEITLMQNFAFKFLSRIQWIWREDLYNFRMLLDTAARVKLPIILSLLSKQIFKWWHCARQPLCCLVPSICFFFLFSLFSQVTNYIRAQRTQGQFYTLKTALHLGN